MNKPIIPFLLILSWLYQIQQVTSNCNVACSNNDCCSNGNCNGGSSSNCCGSNNCCNNNCCDNNRCCGQSSCCNQCQMRCRTTDCYNNCQQNCCRCDVQPEKERITESPRTFPPITRFPVTPSPIVVTPSINEQSQSSNNVNNTNDVKNNVTLNLNLQNTINNVNHVEVPINITNHNAIDVKITPGSSVIHERYNQTKDVEIITIRVPYPVPIPIPVPQTSTPSPPPVTPVTCAPTGCCSQGRGCRPPIPNTGCCFVVIPCIQPCNPFQHVCNENCIGNYMFTPTNPCAMGCQKRPFSIGNTCSMSGYCRQTLNDCSSCNVGDFFTTYGGYQQCGGCFY